MQTNSIPTYFAIPLYREETQEIVPNCFVIHEVRDWESHYCFTMSNQGDRFAEILKRGIPEDQAKKLFYEMD